MNFSLGDSKAFDEAVCEHSKDAAVSAKEEREFEDGEPANLAGDSRQNANDRLCKVPFFMVGLNDAGAVRVTAVAPYLCYSRKVCRRSRATW